MQHRRLLLSPARAQLWPAGHRSPTLALSPALKPMRATIHAPPTSPEAAAPRARAARPPSRHAARYWRYRWPTPTGCCWVRRATVPRPAQPCRSRPARSGAVPAGTRCDRSAAGLDGTAACAATAGESRLRRIDGDALAGAATRRPAAPRMPRHAYPHPGAAPRAHRVSKSSGVTAPPPWFPLTCIERIHDRTSPQSTPFPPPALAGPAAGAAGTGDERADDLVLQTREQRPGPCRVTERVAIADPARYRDAASAVHCWSARHRAPPRSCSGTRAEPQRLQVRVQSAVQGAADAGANGLVFTQQDNQGLLQEAPTVCCRTCRNRRPPRWPWAGRTACRRIDGKQRRRRAG